LGGSLQPATSNRRIGTSKAGRKKAKGGRGKTGSNALQVLNITRAHFPRVDFLRGTWGLVDIDHLESSPGWASQG
jgi:hypothetical protein